MATIKVPCSSANIGPGFDVIGLALSIHLEIQLSVNEAKDVPLNCTISYEGFGKENVSLDPEANLITRTALYVLKCHGQRKFPPGTHVHIINPIPLGRGLGSSGAAVVGGVALANEAGKLGLSKARILDFCLMIERHPDNVAAALYGGLVASFLNQLEPKDADRIEIPLSEVLPAPAGGVDTGLTPPEPPLNIGHYKKLKWAPEIKCIVIIPDFEVPTADARAVLPQTYVNKDVIYNLQRMALLPTSLGESPPDPDMIFYGMGDRIHQPYRSGLIPGLTELLQSVSPKSHPGLLGICLSGAGPTILALATDNFDSIAQHIVEQFKKNGITCDWKLLEPAQDGMTVSYTTDSSITSNNKPMTYAAAGVSIDKGNELVKRIKASVATTKRKGTDAEIGGFGGILDLHAAGYPEAPILVQAIDGIGTKLKIAFAMGKYDTVGIDLVAMNVNDLVVQGAEPLTFLDYYACNSLDVEQAASFVQGVANGCREALSGLVGGETAEMSGMYLPGEFDAAGCATGAIRRGQVVLPDLKSMKEDDIVLGLASNGPHSNGYSLIRKIVDRNGLNYTDVAPWDNTLTVGDGLLTPTRIYVKSCLAIYNAGLVTGMAHITGGGLFENIPRMLPDHLTAEIDAKTWHMPKVLRWLKQAGNVASTEYARVWNTGIGMMLVVPAGKAQEAIDTLTRHEELVYEVGKLVKRVDGGEGCVVKNMDVWDD